MALTHVRAGRHGVATGAAAPRPPASSPELVVSLDDVAAADPAVAGRKAAALATARRLGLPALPGFVITVPAAARLAALGPGAGPPPALAAALGQWRAWLAGDDAALVVRSSSPGEDREDSSMAGQFTSLLDVRGAEAFLAAAHTVAASALAPAALAGGDGTASMAVLVQPQVRPAWGGVLFGVDPVTGRADRLALAVVRGGPDRLVSGEVAGSQWTLNRRGRLLAGEREGDGEALPWRHRRQLAALARRTASAFGGPQDIEWAVGDDGRLLLLQSRPVTAVGPLAPGRGPVYGPGPVAETFPDPLSPLEADLWLPPLGTALREAVLLTGAASRRRLDGAPVVTEVGGRAAVHLGLLGIKAGRVPAWARLDPRPPARRLYASWRTGRLRAALPLLAEDTVRRADAELAAMPSPAGLDDASLVVALRGSHQALVALHGYEILAGMLAGRPGTATTGAAHALRALAAERARGAGDRSIVARRPEVLALVAPAIGRPVTLPPAVELGPPPPPAAAGTSRAVAAGSRRRAAAHRDDRMAELREQLRLRVRWLHQLTAVVAEELGHRLATRGALGEPGAVRWLHLDELERAVLTGQAVAGLAGSRARVPSPAPLPAAFRVAPGGAVVAVAAGAGGAGRGAGGGRAEGRVVHRPERAEAGDILVVRTLDPGLAAVLPRVRGLVAETGSVLSHLAILAREFGVATVVGVPDALSRFPSGAVVLVDGMAGSVELVDRGGDR